jgi:predicted ATP-grasp superfamily ATP-dependent carboligase
MGVIQAGNLVRLFNMRPVGEVVFYGFPDNLIVDSMGVGKIPTVDIYHARTGDYNVSVFTTMVRQQYIDSLGNRERNMFFSSLLYTMKLVGSSFLLTIDCINVSRKNRKSYLIVNSSKLAERFKDREEYVLVKRRRLRSSLALAVAMARFQNIPALQIVMPARELTESRVQHGFQSLVSIVNDVLALIGESENS